ncbi:MAG TPA: hypothetical protein VFA11_11800 [Acidimicrobiales bacterium]|nr:hypothetical protein [Acidimicrobiales bacterium]
MRDGASEPVTCPHCGAAIDPSAARWEGGTGRLGCPRCALQLVRRPGEDWAGIRG